MFRNKKKVIILILSVLAICAICLIVVYTLMLHSSKMEYSDWYGTYQFDIRNLDNTEYLAIIPPLTGDANESEGKFQWYNIDKKVLAQGTCKIIGENYITIHINGNSIGTIFYLNEKYYFVGNSLEPQEIEKISKEPMVSTPLE